jgi:hypothetical protein
VIPVIPWLLELLTDFLRYLLFWRSKTAKVRIRLYHRLPQVCALCGEPAVLERTLGFGNAGAHDTSAAVALPLCGKHRNYRRGEKFIALLLASAPFAIINFWGTVLTKCEMPKHVLLASLAIAFALWLCILAWVIMYSRRIRASRFTSPMLS